MPEPDSPIMATYSPSSTEKSTWRSAMHLAAAETGGIDLFQARYIAEFAYPCLLYGAYYSRPGKCTAIEWAYISPV